MNSNNILIARICHDLITTLNGANLGLEAFESSNDASLLTSIRESVNKANTIIKFIREMFSERADTFCYSSFSLSQDISDFLKFNNIAFNLESDMENIANVAGKIIMHMAIIAKEIMPFGGIVYVKMNDELGEIITRCSGKGISIPNMNIDTELNHKNIIRYHLLNLLDKSEFSLNLYEEKSDIIFYKKIAQ